MQLPVYVPTIEEQSDPALYASNVREYILRYSGLKPSDAVLADKRAYHEKLRVGATSRSRKSE
jgi:hypothetical protein